MAAAAQKIHTAYRDQIVMKKIAAVIASLLLTPTAASAERVWTVVYKDLEPEKRFYRYTNFDVSSIVRNGDRVFAPTLNTSSKDRRGGAVHTTVADCKENTIIAGTSVGHKYQRVKDGEWWLEHYLDESPRFSWYKDGIYRDNPKMVEDMKQLALNSDKRYEAMFNFLCAWK